jgi:aryl-alcohol dehydrogenase-like predicted oxidoreductase
MDTVKLKHTDLNVSRICLGTMTFGSQTDEAAAARMIDICSDSGINFLDTANVYNKGASEEMLGRILRNRRRDFILASKVRNKMGDAPDQIGLSRPAILRAIDESLRRLQTDYLDLYYLHLPDSSVPIEESLDTMNDLLKQGKVRYLATSNYSAWQMTEMFWMADRKKYQAPWVAQPMYNLIARGIEQEYLPMCKRFGVPNIVYNPLAGGLLTGKHKSDAPIPGTRFDKNKMYMNRYWHPQDFEAVEQLRAIADKAGRSLLSLSLNWLYHHTAIECIILGASRIEHLEQNLAVLREGALAAETVQDCDKVWAQLRGPTPNYNR